MRTEHSEAVTNATPILTEPAHTHPEKRTWPWLVSAFLLCPCHLFIVLAILGTGAFGGLLARNQGVLLAVLAVAFGLALWRYLSQSKTVEACPACREERR